MTASERKYEEKDYSAIDHDLRAAIDEQYGITRTKVEGDEFPTGAAVIRNAIKAKEISAEDINHKLIDKNNMLLRCLGRLRGIDYVLRQMAEDKNCPDAQEAILNELRKKIQDDFSSLRASVIELSDDDLRFAKKLSKLEKQFNTNTLCKVLHDGHLDEGCSSTDDYEALLFHYRNLSALIDPAPSLVTVSYDAGHNKVVHRTIQHPIAKKSKEQKDAIRRSMSEAILFPTGEEMSYQTEQPMGMQIANRHFAELAARDDRMLGAQARKSHLYGSKNAFLVTEELVFDIEENEVLENPFIAKVGNTEKQSFARSAMPVYIGSGETDASIQESFRDNLEQVHQFAKDRLQLSDMKLHYTCLITDTNDKEKQHFAIGHIVRGTRERKASSVDYSYMPCNWDGTHRRLDLSSMVDAKQRPSVHPTPSNQAERYRRAAKVSTAIRGTQGVFELVTCMSGQDRTGTEAERASQEWARACYKKHKKDLTSDPKKGDAVEATRAKGRNAADINAHMVGGSPGCKPDSRGKFYFSSDSLYSPETDKAMYLDSAETNKANKVDKRALRGLLHETSLLAEKQYEAAFEELELLCQGQGEGKENKSNPLKQAGSAVLAEVRQMKESASPQELGISIRTLKEAAKLVQGPEQDARSYAAHITRLGAIAKELNKKSRWKKLAGALLILGGAALIAAGLLLAIPSGGSSLLFALLGAKAVAAASLKKGVSFSLVGAGVTYFGGTQMKPSSLVKSMQVLEKRGKEVYVTVPFPSRFFLEYYRSKLLGEGLEDLEKLSVPQILSPLSSEEKKNGSLLGDLYRTEWECEKKKIKLTKVTEFKLYVNDIIEKMPELKLTREEAQMVLTARSTLQGKWLQGGSINAGALAWSTGAAWLGVISNGAANIAISRNRDGSLKITSTLEPERHTKLKIDMTSREGGNPYQYQETYTLKNEGSHWKLTLEPQNSLRVHPEAWRHILDEATKALAQQKTGLTKEQLFSYVPLLMDKAFAVTFAKKLSDSPDVISRESCQLLVELIEKCHGSRDKQPLHIHGVVDRLTALAAAQPVSQLR